MYVLSLIITTFNIVAFAFTEEIFSGVMAICFLIFAVDYRIQDAIEKTKEGR